MTIAIHKSTVRARLAPRREPYWAAPLAPGRFLGFRKIDAQRGSWIARARNEEGGGQRYNALGELTATFDYAAAVQKAREWFLALDAGVVNSGKFTLADACREYVEDRGREKGERCAADAQWRFGKYVYGTEFGQTELARLRTPAVKKWRDGLKLTRAGSNRMMTSLRAALNLAVADRRVPATVAIEWRAVRQHRNADRRRDIFLDLTQRRALLGAATGAVRDLIEAVMLTGARPGEVTSALRSAFDARTRTLRLSGKTGTRTIPLAPAALELFARLARDKLPAAHLLTRDDGKPWVRAEWSEDVRAAAARAKLPHGTCLYTLRHSWITTAITSGITTMEVAKVTGTSLAMIDKHYSHLVVASAERLAAVQML